MDIEIKYVTFKDHRDDEYIITFPSYMTHSELAESVVELSDKILKPISGGFVEHGECVGESISLNLKSRGEKDTLLLKDLVKGAEISKIKQASYIFSMDSMVSVDAPSGTDPESLHKQAIDKFKRIVESNNAELICEEAYDEN